MRFFRALCATLGALLITSTVVFGAHAADAPTLSEAYVLTKDGQLVDTLTVVDPSRTMSESACTPYAGSSTDQHVEFVTRDDATVCHMQLMYTRAQDESEFTLHDSGTFVLSARTDQTLATYRKTFGASLTFASVSLSVEGEVQSATSGAATSATTYEGRALSVSTWTGTVPQVITVNGTLAAGGNPSAAAGANALKDPWGATPVPGSQALVRFRFLFGSLSRASDRLNRRPHRHRAGRRHRHLHGSFEALEGVQPGRRTERISVPRTSPIHASGDAGLEALRSGASRRHVDTGERRPRDESGPRGGGPARGGATPLYDRFLYTRPRVASAAQAA